MNHKKSNERMMKWGILILLLLLAFKDKLISVLGLDCSCETPGNQSPGDSELNPNFPPEPGIKMGVETKEIDVELYERSQDQNVMIQTDDLLERQFFPGNQTLLLTRSSYEKNVV